MVEKVDYKEVESSFIATFGRTNFISKNKPRVGISPIGIWLGFAHPEIIVNNRDNTIAPVGVLRWEWIKRIDISDISQDGYGFIVFLLHDFEAVWATIPTMNKIGIKSAVILIGDEGKVLAYPAHIAFDFSEDDYNSFIEIIEQKCKSRKQITSVKFCLARRKSSAQIHSLSSVDARWNVRFFG